MDHDAPSLRFLLAGRHDPDTVEIYALHDHPDDEAPADQLNRINGMPIGVTDERWPLDEDGRRYAHICTLDLATMPALAAAEPGYRAAVLFVCDPAREGGEGDPQLAHRWVLLREEEVARGIVATRGMPAWGPDDREPARPFHVEAHRVPRAVFAPWPEDRKLSAIHAAFCGLHGRAGGAAVPYRGSGWWPTDAFFLQIDVYFGGLSVGKGFAYIDRVSMRCDDP